MLRLTTLDGITLERDGRPLQAVQNRRLSVALLLILAVRGARGLSRDAIIELLWPDNALKDPKHSLDQLLTVTRTMSGEPDLFVGSATIKLNGAAILTDVDAFEAASRESRFEGVAELYRAPFAEGFSAGSSSSLEQFLSNAATKFALAHATALRTLAERAEARQAHGEAARWWRALLETDQLDSSVVLRLVASLAASDRIPEALRTGRGYATLLRAEREREDPEIQRWLVRLEKQLVTPAPVESRDTPESKRSGPAEHRVSRSSTAEREHRANLLLTRVIGSRYRIERLLRTGSIATVYAALDTAASKRYVELYLLEPMVASCATAEHFADVFRRVMLLSHPNVVSTLDAGDDASFRFVATAATSDATLDARLKREGAFPIGAAVLLAREIAAAIAFAHARGVFHGDLRPRHVVLGTPNSVRAFGFAESIVLGASMEGSAVLTLGTTLYQSPEQLMGEVKLDARSDVYAVGCMLFEMLVGEPPFGGPSRPSRMLKLSHPAPLVRDFRETVPEALAEVVRTCLARVPADRFASGVELVEALNKLA